ncbi:MAG TPA: plasmid pRiA4b ORF-3 family protein [Thermoguttaceae bacterium]|nr:plasmid pRiA4b ORF-3 family protein [Thermoguttaceae bacterium]
MAAKSIKKTATKKKEKTKSPDKAGIRLYTLNVELVAGRVTEEYDDENPVVSRAIQIRGDQTLEDLHFAIFDAFDRYDEHLYEFQFGSRPQGRKNKRYVLPMDMEDPWFELDGAEEPAEDLTRTTIESLRLRRRMKFWYWFDFGDDWWHRIEMVDVGEPAPRHRYPKVVKRVGKSPPQYPNWDEEE